MQQKQRPSTIKTILNHEVIIVTVTTRLPDLKNMDFLNQTIILHMNTENKNRTRARRGGQQRHVGQKKKLSSPAPIVPAGPGMTRLMGFWTGAWTWFWIRLLDAGRGAAPLETSDINSQVFSYNFENTQYLTFLSQQQR